MTPFPIVDLAIVEVIQAGYPAAVGHVGGDVNFPPGTELYVQVSPIPGSGSADIISGQWAFDIDVFSTDYLTAMDHALAVDAALMSAPHVTSDLVLDSVYQNEYPAPRPWGDDGTTRIGATYVFVARRRD